MRRQRALGYLAMLVALFASSGANCRWWRVAPRVVEPHAPELGPPQSLSEAIDSINANSRAIQQLQADGVELSMAGAPNLQADLALERPRRFRMRAHWSGLTGTELDIGSNDDFFWMWAKRDRPPKIYFARHDQYGRSPVRQIIPIEPNWLIEALGIVQLDPAGRHEGPYSRGDGRFEIRTHLATGGQKVTVIDPRYRWVTEQHVYDAGGQLLASALASRHRYYPHPGVSLPMRVDVHLPPARLSFQIDIKHHAINQLLGDRSQLFSPNQLRGYPLVNVADPNFVPPGAPGNLNPETPREPLLRSGNRPRYRGLRR